MLVILVAFGFGEFDWMRQWEKKTKVHLDNHCIAAECCGFLACRSYFAIHLFLNRL